MKYEAVYLIPGKPGLNRLTVVGGKVEKNDFKLIGFQAVWPSQGVEMSKLDDREINHFFTPMVKP